MSHLRAFNLKPIIDPLKTGPFQLYRLRINAKYPISFGLQHVYRSAHFSTHFSTTQPQLKGAQTCRFISNFKAGNLQTNYLSRLQSTIAGSIEMNFDQDLAKASTHDRAKSHNSSNETHTTRPIVGYFYLFTSALVFSIVLVGGLTRLTESGLSIVEWNVITGMKPPRNQEEWEMEFEKYKKFPEFQKLNQKMTIDEFKFIYYMEWGHRMLGRFIGLSFVLPMAYFAKKGYMSSSIKKRSLLVAGLIGCQGLLGWYMVKSGLDPKLLENPYAVPRVSQYWLSAHLGSAFVIYSITFMTALGIIRQNRPLQTTAQIAARGLLNFKRFSHVTAGLIFMTAMSGALVAGLDAGLIYNEFPYMGESLIPSDMWALSETANGSIEGPLPWWKNLLENPAAVQFDHRVLAMSTAATVCALWVYSRRLPLPKNVRIAVNSLLGVTAIQVTLGISTLVYLVPIPVAAAHQGGSLTLLTVALWLMHNLKRLPK